MDFFDFLPPRFIKSIKPNKNSKIRAKMRVLSAKCSVFNLLWFGGMIHRPGQRGGQFVPPLEKNENEEK